MEILIIPFLFCLALAAIPFLIQLIVCIAFKRLWIRLVPIVLSATCCLSYFLPYLSSGDAIGNAFEGMLLLCMAAALVIAHGVPFLIVGSKK